MDTQVQGCCCTRGWLQALYPSVLPASQSCLLLCSGVKLDHDCPWLLPENAPFPGKWSWVGKGEHGIVPPALPTADGDGSCGGDGARAALPCHHSQGVGMERPAGGQQFTQDFPLLAAHSSSRNPPPQTSRPRGQGKGGAEGWRELAPLGLSAGRVPSSGLSPWPLLSG